MHGPPAPPSPARKAPKEKEAPPSQPPRPLALFGCAHGELYVPPLGPSMGTAAARAAAAAGAKGAAAHGNSGSFATLASRMRAMGWKVGLLTDYERQLLRDDDDDDGNNNAAAPATTVTVVVLGAPTRRLSQDDLGALRRWLLGGRGGRLWLLAEGGDPAGGVGVGGGGGGTNLWRRFAAPVLGIAPRAGEAVVRLAPWPAAPPLLARAAAAALEVAALAEEEEEEGEGEEGEEGEGAGSTMKALMRASAALRRVRRAAPTSGLCLHPRHALVGAEPAVAAGGGGGGANAAPSSTTTTTSNAVLNRSVARAFLLEPADADCSSSDDAADHHAFVFANGCPLDVFLGRGGDSAAASAGIATPLLASGRQCYPMDRPLMAAWEQAQQPEGTSGGRALVVGSAAMFSDAWLGGGSSNAADASPAPTNRCDGNRRLADWCLRWLSAPAGLPTAAAAGGQDELQLDAADAAAARAALGRALEAPPKPAADGKRRRSSAGRRYQRPPHALLPAIGALASRIGGGGDNVNSSSSDPGGQAAATGHGKTPLAVPTPLLPPVHLPPAGALRGDWRAMLDQSAFDGLEGGRGEDPDGEDEDVDSAAAALAARLVRPLV